MVQFPFVGRVREQRSYQALLAGEASPCWLLVITGQGGNGKTALLRHLKENTPQDIPVITLNFADPSVRNDPLAILNGLVEQGEPYCDPQRVDLFRQALQAGRNELVKPRDISQTITASDHGIVQGNQLTINTNEQRQHVYEQVRRAFYHMMDTFQPMCLVLMFDTCEWLNEPESVEVGQWLLNGLLPGIKTRLYRRRRRALAVIASRLSLQFEAFDRQEQHHLILPMLDEQAVEDYLQHIGVQDAVLYQRVYDLTHGHALCVSIIATLWQEQPFSLEDLPVLQGRFTEQALLTLIDERILDKRLKTPFRELTHYSVLLRSFNLPMLQAVFPDLKLDYEQFRHFLRYPYVESLGNHRYAIHDLVREIIADAICEQEPQQWQIYHKHALEYLTQTSHGPQMLDWYYHAIALAQDQGMSEWNDAIQNASIRGLREAFATLLQIAQDQTLKLVPEHHAWCLYWQGWFYSSGYQKDTALASYEQALDLFRQVGDRLGEANVRKAMGDVQQFRDERDAALASYEQALDLFRQVGSKLGEANVRKAMGDVQQFRKEMHAALASYEQALDLFRQVGDRLGEANVRQAMGDVQQFRKEMHAALASYEQALDLFRQVGDRLGEANVRQAMGDVQQFRKEMHAALASYEQALDLFRQVGDRLGEANVRQAMGDVQQFRKEMHAALASYEQALDLFRQVGDRLGEANVRQAMGDVQQFRKEMHAALASYEQALDLFRQVGSKLGEANVRKAMGDVQQFRKEMHAALASYEQALDLFRQVGDRLGEANVRKAMGDVQQFRKEMHAALASYEQALDLFRQVGDRLGEANVRKAMGDVQQFRKEMHAALASYEQALDLFRQVGDRLGEANVRKAMGDVQQFRKEMHAALASYEQALDLFRQVGSKLGEANVRKAMGDVQQFRDERDAALASYEQALDLFRQVGDRLGEANCYLTQGLVALEQEDYHNALALHSKAYQLYHQIQDGYSLTRLLYYRSFVYEAMKEQALALQDVSEALIITQQLNLSFMDALQQRFDTLRGS